MNISRIFIERPIGTTLLAIGLFLVGLVAFSVLPVASLPSIEFPTIRVAASRPGADPATMAATVAAPLERRLAEIAGVTEITSVNSLGTTSIGIQFDLSRGIDGAARDVQAALNAAASDLPGDLPTLPTFKKLNPSAAPVLIIALTSDTVSPSAIYDAADTIIGQRISQIEGVAEVNVSGAEQPAIRVKVNPAMLSSMGVSMEEVRAAIDSANAIGPIGVLDGNAQAATIATNDQLRNAKDYANLVVKTASGSIVRLSQISNIEPGVRNTRSAAWYNRKQAVLLIITKQANANVIETVDRIKALIPQIKTWIPAGIDVSVLTDRTTTIRASVADMQRTLLLTVFLVMFVVFLFLRRTAATIAAGVTVPLSLAGTCAAMWLAGFSIDNISLMALAICVGFVVDDAIVMIENAFRYLEAGLTPMQAALEGARQIGFTVISISLSLLAAFIPLLFMGGIPGRLLREFSVTLAFAIIISTVVSLSVTPMICAHFVRKPPSPDATWLDRAVEAVLSRMIAGYAFTLKKVIDYFGLMLLVMLGTIVLTVQLYIKTPKGFIPQDDTGLIMAMTEAATDTSYQAMATLQQRAVEIILTDPAVDGMGSTVGSPAFGGPLNQGRLFINLKPIEAREGLSTARVIDRLRRKLAVLAGFQVYLNASQDLRVGARQGKATYQFTLWDPDAAELQKWLPLILERVRQIPGLTDVATDNEQGGLQANVIIDRTKASNLGVQILDIDNALNNAFSQRQVSTIYTQRNQYRVILEVDPKLQTDPTDLGRIYVTGANNAQIPLSTVARFETGLSPLVINHQGQFPSVTVTYNLKPDAVLQKASDDIALAIAGLGIPDQLHAEPAGDAKAFAQSAGAQPILILTALIAVYIVLGVLYESLVHPLTIISTLPSAGLGALLALQVSGVELSVIALIGIILLIGIVKKNGIMLVDFALEAERKRGLEPKQAIFEACIERFRPILMTTMAAMLGSIPLAIATGPGSELRRPLGITILGGLLVSQILTLYTTPVIYLLLDKLSKRRRNKPASDPVPLPA